MFKDTLHNEGDRIVKKVEGLFHIIPLEQLRHTENVDFEVMAFFEAFSGVDIVKHEPGARSPGAVNGEGDYWYMHPHQEDNMITMCGNRFVQLYTEEHGKIETFELSYEWVKHNGEWVHKWPALLGWPKYVFHRNYSPEGSTSINFAIRTNEFDLDTEFNIYDVDESTGKFEVKRIWKLDQPQHD